MVDFDTAVGVLLWEGGDADPVPLASPLRTTSPGPVSALAALSAEAKRSKATLLQTMQD